MTIGVGKKFAFQVGAALAIEMAATEAPIRARTLQFDVDFDVDQSKDEHDDDYELAAAGLEAVE